jgi:hypothetical protein
MSVLPFENGEVMDRPTFHARYEQMPGVRAELIGGMVFLDGRKTISYGRVKKGLLFCFSEYEYATPGVECHPTALSVLMSPTTEVQPDGVVFIRPEAGGQVTFEDDYTVGAPELVIEVATSPGSIDLHRKRDDYERHGVLEYIVFVLRQHRVVWYRRQGDAFVEQTLAADGILRVGVFPGLWLDVNAILDYDHVRA